VAGFWKNEISIFDGSPLPSLNANGSKSPINLKRKSYNWQQEFEEALLKKWPGVCGQKKKFTARGRRQLCG
jgi:hypothetical protein